MFTNNIIVFILIIFICIIICKTYSFENDEQEALNDVMIDSNPSLINQYSIKDFETPTFSNHRRSESAEKYFGWARKTNRPVEFLRGRRFWLFAKKDEGGINAETFPLVNTHQNSLTQGLWRSGIVGRRRR